MAFKVIAQFRPGYPQTSSAVQAPMWVDITERIDFQSLQWDQQATDKNTSLRFDIFTFLPLSTTRYDEYASWAGESAPIDPEDVDPRLSDAIHDTSFFIDLTNRAEVKLLDGATVLWGGVIGSVDTERVGASHVVQRVEAYDFTALLDELVVRDYNAPNVSESLNELATETGLTSQVVTGGSALIAGAYTFRVIAVDGAGDPLTIFTHITQYITPSDVNPADITDTPLRTIQLEWTEVAGVDEYLVYAKQGIGTTGLYLQATIAAGTETYSLSTTPVSNTVTSPEQYVQKGSIDVDIISGSGDPENGNYKGIFNAIDPALDPGINNTTYVKPAKVLAGGEPDPENSYRFSPVLETGVVLTSPFGGKTLKQALKTISDKTGAIFWVDAEKNLHYANKKAQELVENPRFDSSSTKWTLGTNHTIQPSRGPFGFGNALIASTSSSTNETKSDPIDVTASSVYMARVRGWANANFASDWDCELRYYSDAAGLTQVGGSHKLHRTVSFDGTDEQRWCKTWVIATAHNTAVTARLVAKRKAGASGACGWTDFSLIEITGSYGFSDRPSENEYAIPMRGFETPKAPREASGIANRLLVYGVYKDPTNTNELESVEYNAGLALTKALGGSLTANTYWVRVIAETPDGDVYVKYAKETITDADVAAPSPVRTLSANWAAVPTATQYRIYVGSGRMAMRLKATQAGTSLSISTPAAGGAGLSGEPDIYYYKTFDFAPGLWESGGKVVEASLNDQLVDSEVKAETRALSFWEEKGIAMRTWEFDHLEEAPEVGTVIPFIWEADDIAEPLVVKGTKGKFLGDRIFWTTTLGSDPSLIKKGVTQIFADIKQASLRLNDVLPPTRPTNLALSAPSASLIQTVDGVTRSTVIAQWDPSAEDDFSNYVVQYGYDSNFANAQVINVAQTPTVRSTSTGQVANVVHSFQAEPGKRLYFRVAAQDRTGNRSDFTDSAVDLPSDTTPPDAPTGVTVTASLKSMAIAWGFGFYDPAIPDQNTNNTDFSRFKVYRKQYNAGTTPNEPWVKIAETSTNVYIDTSFPNYTNLYQYKVSAVDRTGNESAAVQETTPTFRSPNKITGTVDIEAATISSAQISSLTANLITAGTLNISTGMSVISDGTATLPQFEVDKDGVTIRDDAGNIVLKVNGNTSELNADYIDVTNLAATEVTVGSGANIVRVGNYPTASASPTFQGIWAGSSDPTAAEFTVNTLGVMTATSASITGTVTANSGAIGGWAIDSNKIYQALAISPNIAGIYTGSSASNGLTFFAGATTSTGTSAAFTVTNDGAVTASNANVTGTISTNNITATGGTVGGWTLSSTSLTSGTGATTVGIATSGGYAFYAGDSTPATAEFRVTPGGVLTATSATITGTVTAEGGAIGGWTISPTTISSSSGNVVLSNSGIITAGATAPNQAHMSGNGFWAGASSSSSATAPFRVSNEGGVTAANISIIGGTLSVGDIPVSVTFLSRAAEGTVTIKTSSLVSAVVGQYITVDVTSAPWASDADFNGAFRILTRTSSAPYIITYAGATASAVTEVAATGSVFTGAKIFGESASGTWFTVNEGFALKNPADVGQDIIIASASGVSINADFINTGKITLTPLDSDAISSTNFTVSNTGTITAKDGTIGGWTLTSSGSTRFYAGTSSAYTGLVATSTSTGIAIFAGADDSSGSNADFFVRNNGSISATSGAVGGWTLSSTSLTAGSLGTTVGIDSGGTNPAFYAGSATPGSAPFRVTQAGVLNATGATISGAITATSGSFTGDITTNNISATAGTVGGWTLTSSGSTRLYAGTGTTFTGLIANSASSSAVTIFAGATNNAGQSPLFSVTNAGYLTASSGLIGGFTLASDRLTNLGASKYAGIIDTALDTGLAFFAGATNTSGSSATFAVTNAGAVTASDITATGGTVGGWTLASSRLYSSATSGATTKFYGVAAESGLLGQAFFAGATNSAGDGAVFEVLNDGSVVANNLSITGGPAAGNVISVNSGTFSVTSAGAMTATSASVSGSITATSGSIGGWSVDSSRIYNALAVSPYIAGVQGSSTSTGVAFFAGGTSSTGATAAFKVTNDGALTATNATITGAVTATSGSFTGSVTANSGSIGGWEVDSTRIYNALAVSPYISGLQGSSTSSGIAFFAGATSSSGASALYSVTNAGALTASSGTIGGFTLSSTSLTAGTGSAAVGLLPGSYPFFAGSSTASSAPFRVTSAGAVTTTDLTIQGADSAITGVSTNAGLITMKAKSGQVGAVIEAQKPDGTTTGSVLGLRAGGGGTTGTLGGTIGAVVVYDGTGDQGTLITGGLMISNDYTKAGSASYPLPKDGVIVFTDSVTSSYAGGGDLFQNPINTINTSGNFRVRKNLTVNDELTVDGGINALSVVANGGGIYSDALTTGGHAAMRFRSLAETNLGNISMATSGQFYFNTGTSSDRSGDILAGDISASGGITAGGSVTVDDTAGVYFNVATGTDGNIYYSAANYFLVNDDLRVNMAVTSSTSDLYINTASGYGTLARFSSARRYKQDIQDFTVPLSDVLQLRPVTFKWNPETTKSDEAGSMTGLIAEEVEAISDDMKRICRYNEETGEIESVQYSQLPVFFIGAIKELAQKNSALEARIAELESR